MDTRTEPIRQDIDTIRDSMTDKMEQIEAKIKGTVDDVKGTVNDTVDQVKQVFDLNQQVSERPWTMLGASVLAGFVLGSLGGSDDDHHDRRSYGSTHNYRQVQYYPSPEDSQGPYPPPTPSGYSSQGSTSSAHTTHQQHSKAHSGFMSDVTEQFRDEIDMLKSAAVATVTTMLRDMLKKNIPQFADEFERARTERDQQQGTATTAASTDAFPSSGIDQHTTARNSSYINDLDQPEPDPLYAATARARS